jgi:hypothetical protein
MTGIISAHPDDTDRWPYRDRITRNPAYEDRPGSNLRPIVCLWLIPRVDMTPDIASGSVHASREARDCSSHRVAFHAERLRRRRAGPTLVRGAHGRTSVSHFRTYRRGACIGSITWLQMCS